MFYRVYHNAASEENTWRSFPKAYLQSISTYLHEAMMRRCVKSDRGQYWWSCGPPPNYKSYKKIKTLLVFHKDCLSRHNTLHEHILVTFYGILIRGVFRTQSNMQDGALSFTHMFTVLWIRLCWSLRICQW